MKTYRIKVKQVYIETMFAEAESEKDAIQMVWSDDCRLEGSEYKSAEADIQSIEEVWLLNYSQKVLFDDWISRCPIEGVFVDEPVSQVKMDDGQFGYLVKVFLTINKKDWEENQSPPGISENFEKF